MWYHVTNKNHGKEVWFKPRIPLSAVSGIEDVKTPRICFAPTVEQCLMAVAGANTWQDGLWDVGTRKVVGWDSEGKAIYRQCPVYVYVIHGRNKVVAPTKRQVRDAPRTNEVWRLEPVRLKKVGVIDKSSWDYRELTVKWF